MPADWKAIIAGGETPGVDFKGPMAFDGPDRLGLLKDIAAMANSRGGGTIVVGVSEHPDAHRVEGLTDEQLDSFDPTVIVQVFNGYFRPPVAVRVEKVEVDGRKLACLFVSEFASVPVIAFKSGTVAGKPPHFRDGSVLVRTAASQSKDCQYDEMRDLLDRAVARRVPASPPPAWGEVFAREAEAVRLLEDGVMNGSNRAGAWSFSIFPLSTLGKELQPRALTDAALRSRRRTITGQAFLTCTQALVAQDGVQCNWQAPGLLYFERWRAFRSGPFVLVRTLNEAVRLEGGPNLAGKLGHPGDVDRVLEFVLFARAYLKALELKDPVLLRVRLLGMQGRELAPDDAFMLVDRGQACVEDTITVECGADSSVLDGEWDRVVVEMAVKILQLFQLEEPPESVMQRVEAFRHRAP